MQLQKNDIEDKDTILELKIQKGGHFESFFRTWERLKLFSNH
jgi:hypothetical protein